MESFFYHSQPISSRDMNRLLPASLSLGVIVLIVISASIEPVGASVPEVLSVENISRDQNLGIRIYIKHENPSATHFVDKIEVAGSASGQTMTRTFTLSPQNSTIFIVELSQFVPEGVVPLVKVRAHCTLDGWSSWSEEVQVPEFPMVGVLFAVSMVLVLIVIRRQGAAG